MEKMTRGKYTEFHYDTSPVDIQETVSNRKDDRNEKK